MTSSIEVHIAKRGTVRDATVTPSTTQSAHCDLCEREVDAVASTTTQGGAPFACKNCLRQRLEAMTVGAWQLRDANDTALPWGKVSG